MPYFKIPTQQQIDTAVQRMRSPDFAAYFLSRLKNPHWIGPLRKKSLFANPPPPVLTGGRGLSYPHWPASEYLARMAADAPAEVADVFAAIETDNLSVIGDMLRAALAMPAEVATTLVPAVCRAARAGTLWIYLKDAGDLCARLVDANEIDAALTLAEALFAPTFEPGHEEPRRRDQYWYRKGLKRVEPLLAERRPAVFLPMLCDWLNAAVETKSYVDRGTGDDESWLWRPAIEEHGQNRDYDFAGVMAGFARAGFECAVRDGQFPFDEAVAILDRYPYLVFKRIRLHLVNEFADARPELARDAMMDRALFNNRDFKHEYAMLVGRRLGLLAPEQRETWFGWIDAGPDMEGFDEFVQSHMRREATEEDRRNRIQYWQFERLHWVREHLDGERRAFYDRMRAEHGEPELADLAVRRDSGWGSESPMTVEALSAMTFEQAVETVSSWRPDKHGFRAPSIEGLASTFQRYVATNPVEFSGHARLVIDRRPIFVRGFIEQMGHAVASGQRVAVPEVLGLCQWVVERPVEERTTPQPERSRLVDRNWQWCRDEICGFLKKICMATVGNLPLFAMEEYRQPIWQMLEILCQGPATSYISHDASRDDPRVCDYLDMAINSPRGKAVESALEYARWVANHVRRLHNNSQAVPGGFDAMPEVREMLEWQIAPENRSFEAMAVIGSQIDLIWWIDQPWLARNFERLFDLSGIERDPPDPYGWAAWNALLVWTAPRIELFGLFESQYAYAVRQAAEVAPAEGGREQPMNCLGEHLMILYGRGQLGLDDHDGLLRRFLTEVHPAIRRHAIGFVGRSLGEDESLPSGVVDRFQTLWETYWAGAGRQDAVDEPADWLFGTWFSCGQFPEQWALAQLEEFVKVAPIVEPGHDVAEQLAELAPSDPAGTMRILDCMVRGDREGWRIHGWREYARRILEAAMAADAATRSEAIALINVLGRRGYHELESLLTPGTTADLSSPAED